MKPFKLLIGYDGSEYSKIALQDLAFAGLPKEVEAVVLSVADTWLPTIQPDQGPTADWLLKSIRASEAKRREAVNEARQTAWDAADALKVRYPAWSIRAEAHADDPGWGLVKFADTWKPDLIVLGTHGRSALGQLFLGSVSQKVLIHARCSVRIARPLPARPSPRRPILLGWDGSAGARNAAHRIAARAWPEGTELHLITGVDAALGMALKAWASSGRGKRGDTLGKRFWLESVTHPLLHDLRKTGLHVLPFIFDGDPRKVLVEEARRRRAVALFVSARGLNAVERFLLGSVSSYVATHAPCSVEVVR